MSLGRRFLSLGSIALPVVVTNSVSNVAATSFTANGNLTDVGGGTGTSVGFYIGTSSTYTNNTKYTVSANASTGTFTYNASGLTSGTSYYVNAFASNDAGEVIGAQVTQATSFSPNLVAQNTNTKLTYSAISQLRLYTGYIDPSTSAVVWIAYFETGNGGTSTSPAHFNGTAPHILNGCRGQDYGGSYGTGTWQGSGGNCAPNLRITTNAVNRNFGGTYGEYYFSHATQNVKLFTYPPSGYSLSNRTLGVEGNYTAFTATQNSSSVMESLLTATGGTNFTSGGLIHDFEI